MTLTWYRQPGVVVSSPYIVDTEDYFFQTLISHSPSPTRRSSHLARRDAPTITTTATTMTACARRVARRGYADPLGMDDARHHIARRIRDVTVRALESYYTVMTYLAYLYDSLLKILPRFHMQHYCFHHLESCLAPGRIRLICLRYRPRAKDLGVQFCPYSFKNVQKTFTQKRDQKSRKSALLKSLFIFGLRCLV